MQSFEIFGLWTLKQETASLPKKVLNMKKDIFLEIDILLKKF